MGCDFSRIKPFVALFSIVATLNYGISVTSCFAAIVTLLDLAATDVIGAQLHQQPRVEDWMLEPDSRFDSTSKLRRLLLSIAPTAAKHIKDAVSLLAEGGLERSSEAELMDLVVAESSRIMTLAKDLATQLRKGETGAPQRRQRQPAELLLLLRNAVRFPRVVKS